MLTDNDVSQFKRDGFLLVKGLLTPEEVARFKAIEMAGETADLASLPGLEYLWADPRLVQIAKRLLGGPITFFGEASYRWTFFTNDDQEGGRLHHDAKGTVEHLFNRQHAPTSEPYPILRFSFYLQDHANHSGGLKLVPQSHQYDSSDFDLAKLTYLDVPSEPGDAVVFCNKLLHAAHAVRPKAGPSLSPPEQQIQFERHPELFFERQTDRRVIFVDFAGGTDLADVYIKSRALNPSSVRDGFADLAENEEFIARAEQAGVRLRLDAAVIEAITKIYANAPGGKINDTARKYARVLPALCRLSQSWSRHFDFVTAVPAVDTVEAGLALAMELAPRIVELRSQMNTRRHDAAMAPRKAAG